MERIELIKTLAEGRQLPADLNPYLSMSITDLVTTVNSWPTAQVTLSDDHANNLYSFFSVENSQQYKSILKTYNQHLNDYNMYVREANRKLADALLHSHQMLDISKGPNISRDILANHLATWLAGQSFYKLLRVDSNSIIFTTDHVKLSTSVPDFQGDERWAVIDSSCDTVDFGKFLVRINERGQITVKPYRDNLIITSSDNEAISNDDYDNGTGNDYYWHPHIDYDGFVCWGNVSHEYSDFKASNTITLMTDILTKLAALLNTYNESSPYRSLEKFTDAHDISLNGPITAYKYDTAWFKFDSEERFNKYANPADTCERVTLDSGEIEARLWWWKEYTCGSYTGTKLLRCADGTFYDYTESAVVRL